MSQDDNAPSKSGLERASTLVGNIPSSVVANMGVKGILRDVSRLTGQADGKNAGKQSKEVVLCFYRI